MATSTRIASMELISFVTRLFEAVGVPSDAAAFVAETLVEADEHGVASHGVMLVPMYIDRLRNGSISLATEGTVVADRGATGVIDAGNALGQLTARQAAAMAGAKAKAHGLGLVTVRNAFHFGMAGRFALDLAAGGAIGIVMCNTRPLLPAPGGSEAMVGNNPLAIAMPANDAGPPVLLDMATSESAMGKIRMALAAGKPIPEGWATDSDGRPTTDPGEAVRGMLLPTGGPKGFGLAFMIDLLCGGLSSGGTGEHVRPLYGDPAEPYNSAHLFLAIDVEHFRDLGDFIGVASRARDRVRASRPAPGVERVMSPGEPAWAAQRSNANACAIDQAVWGQLASLAESLSLTDAIPA
ncbi:MAG: Ldh family oxidoreductase [Alphaproteobacteria bacterium]|nr:Ldh family oxidoreductase [Alphaproteobacteria bacterium]